ncbi:pentatricopeptide repeat-containing protein [Citrus sinensis]|nr:pentatricopeptide repeat-containing protein [Citrus sinensis]
MVVQEMKDMGFARRTIYCYIMMILNYLTGNREKIDALMLEMEEKSINGDQFTLGIRPSAYAAASDIHGMDKIINMTESNPQMVLDFNLLAVLLYMEAGKKDQLYRIWKHYGQTRKVFNKGYMTMMGLLLKLDDVKGAEKTLRNWTSKNLPYDFGLPSSLIDAHCKNGCVEYNQIPKAVEAMKKQSLFVHLDGRPERNSGYLCGIYGRKGRRGRCW